MNHIHLKIDLDVMQSHPLHRTIDNIHSLGFEILPIIITYKSLSSCTGSVTNSVKFIQLTSVFGIHIFSCQLECTEAQISDGSS